MEVVAISRFWEAVGPDICRWENVHEEGPLVNYPLSEGRHKVLPAFEATAASARAAKQSLFVVARLNFSGSLETEQRFEFL